MSSRPYDPVAAKVASLEHHVADMWARTFPVDESIYHRAGRREYGEWQAMMGFLRGVLFSFDEKSPLYQTADTLWNLGLQRWRDNT